MIIDSHAHYAHPRYDAAFPALGERNGEWELLRTDRAGLLEEMRRVGIVGAVEPSIGFDAIEKQLAVVAEQEGYLRAAVGVHPTRCVNTAWANRARVAEYARREGVIAIGETGLDYHLPRRMQHRLRQKRWFVFHIKLACRLGLPLILHCREDGGEALRMLKRYRGRLRGGVAHCFTGDSALAERYIALGFAIGIGGKLLCDDETGRTLRDTVCRVPLSAILVETDAPLVFPDLKTLSCGSNQRKKLCNSSLILPAVLREIAALRGESYETVEAAVLQNTLRVFGADGWEGLT